MFLERLAFLFVLNAAVAQGSCNYWFITHCNYLIEYKPGIDEPLEGISNVMSCVARGAGYNSDIFGFGDMASDLIHCGGCNDCQKVIDSRYHPGSCRTSAFRGDNWLQLEIGEFDCCPSFFETNKIRAFLYGTSFCGARPQSVSREARTPCASCAATENCQANESFDIDRCWDHQSRPQTLIFGSPPDNSTQAVPTREPMAVTAIPTMLRPSPPPTNASTAPTVGSSSHPTTETPTMQPTRIPTEPPSSQPTKKPTKQPSLSPSKLQTVEPSMKPSDFLTESPSSQPTKKPTNQPSSFPNKRELVEPTTQPSMILSQFPTSQPTIGPAPVQFQVDSPRSRRSIPLWAKLVHAFVGMFALGVVAFGIFLWRRRSETGDFFPARVW